MSVSKFEKLWVILTKYRFQCTDDNVSDVICDLCGKIMIDPYISSCGCRFCCTCIKENIIKGNQQCPGGNETCSENYLEIDRNLVKDFNACFDISNLSLKCPHELCSCKIKLEHMENHIRICRQRPTECPYETIGCTNGGVCEENVNEHMYLELVTHSQLLIEAIIHLRNDKDGLKQNLLIKERKINEMKENNEKLERNMKHLGEVCRINEISIMEIKEETSEVKDTLAPLVIVRNGKDNKSQIMFEKEMRMELDTIKSKLREIERSKLGAEVIENVRKDTGKNKNKKKEKCKEIMILYLIILVFALLFIKSEIKIRYISMEITKEKNERIECDSRAMMERFNIENRISKHDKDVMIVRNNTWKYSNIMTIWMRKQVLNVLEDFVWSINDFNNKIKNDGSYESDSFEKDNYKLCLRADINIKYLKFYVVIMKGEKDKLAQWPMNHTVRISILQKDSLIIYKSMQCKYSFLNKSKFKRPSKEKNVGIYCGTLFLEDIKNIEDILSDGSLIVRCSLSLV